VLSAHVESASTLALTQSSHNPNCDVHLVLASAAQACAQPVSAVMQLDSILQRFVHPSWIVTPPLPPAPPTFPLPPSFPAPALPG
jgi:hypothetical protein